MSHQDPLRPTRLEDVTIEAAYAAPLGSADGRPWVGVCMVASIDGSTVVAGASGELSSTNDSGVMLRLRSLADVIIVGSGTVRAEGYGPPRRSGLRIGVVTASGNLDASTALFTSGAGFVITTERATIPDGIDVVRAGTDAVDLAAALASLDQVCPSPRVVQAEGGPTLNGALLAADLVDEINVTTSPLTVGGIGPRLAANGADHAHRFALAQLLVDDESFVYSRWLRERRGDG
ncbi:MAG: dihydrofolate reductase family protein [Ilumatobacteraceae bacterium]